MPLAFSIVVCQIDTCWINVRHDPHTGKVKRTELMLKRAVALTRLSPPFSLFWGLSPLLPPACMLEPQINLLKASQ